VIKGVARDENHVAFAGTTLEVVGSRLKAGETAPVAIRQHDIQLATQAPANQQNALKARVTRQVFLGASRDYLVETPDGTSMRIVTGPGNLVAEGSEVWLTLPPERCLALSR
jgi:iron(III) transport system ATP-binding protein